MFNVDIKHNKDEVIYYVSSDDPLVYQAIKELADLDFDGDMGLALAYMIECGLDEWRKKQ